MTAVTADMPARVEFPGDGHQQTMPARLTYDPATPLEIRAEFHDNPGPLEWTWSRAVLAEALRRPAGLGDVRMWPDGRVIRARLAGEDYETGGELVAVVTLPRRAARRFLSRTARLVPVGREPEHDWSTDLAQLLGGAW